MPNRAPLLAGIDIGTSGVRCLITSVGGHVVSVGHTSRALDSQDGFDPEDLWRDVASAIKDAVADGPGAAGDLVALGLAGHVGTVLVDRQRQIIADGFGWSDTRGMQALARVMAQSSSALGRTGRPSCQAPWPRRPGGRRSAAG